MDRTKAMAEIQIQNMIDEFGFDSVIEGLIRDRKQQLRAASVNDKRLIKKLKTQRDLLVEIEFAEGIF